MANLKNIFGLSKALKDSKGTVSEIGAMVSAMKFGSDFISALDQMENSATELAKQFGQGRENIVNIKATLADASDSLVKVGVNVGDALNKAKQIQMEYSDALGRGALLTTETFGQMEAIYRVTGISTKEITQNFANAGISTLNASTQVQKVVDTARSIGVDAGKASELVVKNLEATTRFNFQGGIEGMAKMAAQAVNLRIDMNSILKIADGLFNPERAIEMAAAMQRLGVAQSSLLDPLRLMDLAQNDPAELQNQIAEMSKQFVRLNKDGQFEIMPGAKRQLMEIESQLGLSRGELSKMALAGAELDDKLSKIKLPDTFTEDQKKFIANMAQMGPGGEYKLKVDGEDVGLEKALQMFTSGEKDLNEFMKAQKPKSMEDLANEQLSAQKRMENHLSVIARAGLRAGMAVGATGSAEEAARGALEITSKLPEIFGKEELSVGGMRRGTEKGISKTLETLSEGNIGEAMTTLFTDTFGYLKDAMNSAIRRAEESVKQIGGSENKVISAGRGVLGSILESTESVTGIETGGEKLIERNKAIMEANAKANMMKQEELNRITSPATQESKVSGQINYNGKLEVEITPKGDLSSSDWKSIGDGLIKEKSFTDAMTSIINNPKGDKNPNEMNKTLNSVYDVSRSF